MSRNCMALFVFSIAQVHSHAYSHKHVHWQTHNPPAHIHTHTHTHPEAFPPFSYVTRIRFHCFVASTVKTTWAIFTLDPNIISTDAYHNNGNINSHRYSCEHVLLTLIFSIWASHNTNSHCQFTDTSETAPQTFAPAQAGTILSPSVSQFLLLKLKTCKSFNKGLMSSRKCWSKWSTANLSAIDAHAA